jgi:hopanoid biosynthesis associated membrane protein HpnM
MLEFAPDATPRSVEEEEVARLPRALGDRLLETVYGFAPDTPTGDNLRVEFSVHPKPRGWLSRHTVLWEKETLGNPLLPVRPTWPNKFSRFLGDKVYGLLMAWLVGLPVPHTTVVGRRFAPFAFGDDTGQREIWLRTAPADHTPGYFSTAPGWLDPFKLVATEDPYHRLIASVLSQRAVCSVYSGAAITESDGKLRVEGVKGAGSDFMLSGVGDTIPREVEAAVNYINEKAATIFGPVSFEWVFDGDRAWVVQLHVGSPMSQGDVIYPGEPVEWLEIPASESLDRLREAISVLDPTRTGVVLVGSIGTSSHKGELLRKARIPSRLRHPSPAGPAEVVRHFYSKLLDVMQHAVALGAKGRYQKLEPVVLGTFDVPFMVRLLVEPAWARLTPDQKRRAAIAYSRYIAAVYATRFDGYSGEKFEVLGEKQIKHGTLVRTQIVKVDGKPVSIDYVLHDNDIAWQIRDTYLSGAIRESATRRSEFSAILRSSGIDGLIASLNEKADGLQG